MLKASQGILRENSGREPPWDLCGSGELTIAMVGFKESTAQQYSLNLETTKRFPESCKGHVERASLREEQDETVLDGAMA
jgi:hypothetical protein